MVGYLPWTHKESNMTEQLSTHTQDQTSQPKGNQPWIFIGRTDAEAEAPILWSPEVKNWLIGKDPDAGTDWRQEKGTTEDKMVGWHHRLDGHEFEQVPGVGDGQGSLVCCSPWGHKESDMTERMNWTELMVLPVGLSHMSFCILKYIPYILNLLRVLSWNDVEFCQMIFRHLLKWSYNFYISLC